MRFLAIDPGAKRLGLAVGDDLTGVATPLRIIAYRGVDASAKEIADLAADHRADAVVIGFPVAEDGSRTPACARSEALAEALGALGVTTFEQGEFLTTDEARRRAAEAGLSPRHPVDHFAALVVLEEFLGDRQR